MLQRLYVVKCMSEWSRTEARQAVRTFKTTLTAKYDKNLKVAELTQTCAIKTTQQVAILPGIIIIIIIIIIIVVIIIINIYVCIYLIISHLGA